MAEKTINLTGAETAVTGLDGSHAAIRNDGTDVIYAAKQPGITPGADGVLSIPEGGSAVLHSISGMVHLSGTGSAMMITSDYGDNPFKTSAQGGSGADDAARAAINEHAGNAEIHVTADEKANWNGKTTLSEAAQAFSNPNLLINPDFRINQRGNPTYNSLGYTVDGWYLWKYGASSYGTVSVSDDGIVLTSSGEGGSIQFCQPIENTALLAGRRVTVSFEAENVSGVWNIYQHGNTKIKSISEPGVYNFTFDWLETSSKYGLMFALQGSSAGSAACKIKWIKLEIGGIATPFIPPDTATEMIKCQRFYQIRSTGDIPAVDLRPGMRTDPTVIQLADGNFAYNAEI